MERSFQKEQAAGFAAACSIQARSVKERGDGDLFIDALHGLGEHGRDGEVFDLVAGGFVSGVGDGVEEDELLDIAGVDYYEKEYGIYSKGASAFGVRTCLEYVMNL